VTKRADGVFDVKRFITDVRAYRRRHMTTYHELGKLLNMGDYYVKQILTHASEPSLFSAVVLAQYADLSLDEYIKVPVVQ